MQIWSGVKLCQLEAALGAVDARSRVGSVEGCLLMTANTVNESTVGQVYWRLAYAVWCCTRGLC